MVAEVRYDTQFINGSINRLRHHLRDRDATMRVIGTQLRDYVRETLTMGGRKRPHAPLSWWTKQRTGRRKPLYTLRKNIKFRSNSETAIVYFDREDAGWDLDLHHKGFRVPAREGLVAIKTIGGPVIYFHGTPERRIPAREIWPTQREVRDLVSKTVTRWIDEGAKRSWRP